MRVASSVSQSCLCWITPWFPSRSFIWSVLLFQHEILFVTSWILFIGYERKRREKDPVADVIELGMRCRGKEEQVDKANSNNPLWNGDYLFSTKCSFLLSVTWAVCLSHSETFEVLWRKGKGICWFQVLHFWFPFWFLEIKFGFPKARWLFFSVLQVMTEGGWVKWGQRYVKTNDKSNSHVMSCEFSLKMYKVKTLMWVTKVKHVQRNQKARGRISMIMATWLSFSQVVGPYISSSYFASCSKWRNGRLPPANWINAQLPPREI